MKILKRDADKDICASFIIALMHHFVCDYMAKTHLSRKQSCDVFSHHVFSFVITNTFQTKQTFRNEKRCDQRDHKVIEYSYL